jgi:hypothetical protein
MIVISDPPPEPKNQFQSATATLIRKLAIGAVILHLTAFIIRILWPTLVPGCHCDEDAGCQGCGANNLLVNLLFGGLIGGRIQNRKAEHYRFIIFPVLSIADGRS